MKKKSPKSAPKKMMKKKTSGWFSWLRTFGIVAVLTLGAGLVALDPSTFQTLQATLLDTQAIPAVSKAADGILLSSQSHGENEEKLLDIFATVFPKTDIRDVPYRSEEGRSLVQQLGVKEVPTITFKKEAFDQEKLSEVVKDLFSLQGDYYVLNVALVNASGQVRIDGPLNAEGGVRIGVPEAPITVSVYSNVKCQHCRANERNHAEAWKKLADEGLVQLVYLDLPQDVDSTFHAAALSCYFDQKQDGEGYQELRANLFSRTNLTQEYTARELTNAGVDIEKDCNEEKYRELFRARAGSAALEGVTAVPTVYIGQTGGSESIRFTGSKDFAEYQTAIDHVLQGSAPLTEENEAQ